MAKLKQFVADHFDGPVKWTAISSRGSGEHLDREEIYRLEGLIEGGRVDLVIAEDLARIFRRKRAYDLCESCVDFRTRLIAINDRVDTAEDGWEDGAFISTWHHERSNRDTSERIKRSLRNRFQQGGVCQTFSFGYIKPENTKSDADVRKVPEAEPVYDEWFTRLENGETFAEVADWLNQLGIPTGPWCAQKHWDGTLVGLVTRNPILKGERQRNRRISRRVNRTGRRRSQKAPPEALLVRHVPHLAFIEPKRYDRVIRMLAERNAKYRRNGGGNGDPRRDLPRKRTRFPGQMLCCGICGRKFVFGGHGRTTHLMCNGAREHRCWNGSTIDGPLAARKIAGAVYAEIEALPAFDEALLATVTEEAARVDAAREERRRELLQSSVKIWRGIGNVMEFIRNRDSSPWVRNELSRLEQEHTRILADIRCHEQTPSEALCIPPVDDLKCRARETVCGLATNQTTGA